MNIYVGNISWGVKDEDLRDAFMAYGEVESAKIITDRESGRSKGFGFVEMPNDDEGQAAIDALNDQELDGRPLKVNVARPRRPRAESWS
ncbi:RNA recognition motif domain-containing protein [Chitinivibrio alkaliphilus]|uniref:RNA recognition motif-containing protein n=1 Tax=Chitinivibrio alkaliphilus ACht1 TaxID=1313304 RepID=U7DAQ6_9BACT|nr:RNA-binding protein [Chitinivibrio alkaliphilus]ERP31480.1 RNA recognition motif-containing protein [Chitinivibrio alkaliphilus ACht1]